ncbi:Phosphoglucosamine mutase [Planktothrix tepida]|uniref:Phosphoglucosamine mutase n=2 Tax=Planktothrix TaxID=54304 RepID=A0A1J1LER5_9CYAN|nr:MULTISPECIES: phosphoglucosamine mutase [Planktothrix]CAD5913247.1 Phosphoglucosamine mutase [Planktothrix tepida]CAD5986454.1 Phosphoglucosamine mutase [Planktothrix pseudagardhii]CUR30490.1 Phosphoglucosamine mutase [Planktothrix tepida PCC 9214]
MVAIPPQTQNLSSFQKEVNTAQPRTISHFGFTDQVGELPSTPLFGTDGIRGRVGGLLSAPLALQVGFWAGQVLRQQAQHPGPVILGQDTRTSGNMLAMALSAGLIAAGLEVWHIGVCPTPGVAYLTSQSEALGGVMISASHNPPEDNGIKFFGKDGTKLSTALQQQIEAGIRGNADFPIVYSDCGQHYYRPELIQQYAQSLHGPLLPLTNLHRMRVVLDLAWGAAVPLAAQVFTEMGAEVICLHDQPNGHQINVNCGSTHLQQLQQAVLEYNADIGFAFDGDADRVLAVDGQGRAVDGDYILYFWGQTLSQAEQLPDNLIISTVMANLGFERAWQQFGGQLIRTPVGDQHVHAEMKRTGAMLGGEQSGHILCHHYGISGDGLLTALHLAALVKRSGQSLAELVNQSFQTYPQLLKNIRVEDVYQRRHWQECEPLMKTIETAEAAMGNQGRILVRASGTEPLIRVMVEAKSADLADYWANQLVLVVQQHLAV